jgi:hypothetical protein
MKFALLKNINFDPFTGAEPSFLFNEQNYKNYFEDKLEFIDFDDVSNLFVQIGSIINNNVEIFNSYYNDKYLIQSFYYNNPELSHFDKMIFVKRELQKDDTYTYIGHEHDIGFYNFLDVTLDDLVKIFKNKYIINGVKIMATGHIYDIQYVKNKTLSKYYETLHFNGIPSINYLDVLSIVNKYPDNKINDKIMKYSRIYLPEYSYIQKNIEFCVLDIYTETSGSIKNDIASLLIGDDIFGDVILNCQNVLNDDTRILYTNKKLIINIINGLKSKNLKSINKNLFNIYHEFL